MCTYIYTYKYIYICVYIYIYSYVYIERDVIHQSLYINAFDISNVIYYTFIYIIDKLLNYENHIIIVVFIILT